MDSVCIYDRVNSEKMIRGCIMLNPYINRYEKNLYYVLSEDSVMELVSQQVLENVLVVINLYYTDTLNKYLDYISRIPSSIKVIIVSSAREILDKSERYVEKNQIKNVQTLYKKNRGRDVSALLVACRSEILKYKYFCFVHDKKSGLKELDAETSFWIQNLWNNTLINENYIMNVIHLFQEKSEIGLLVPPEPIGETRAHYFTNNWGENIEYAKLVLDKLNIDMKLDSTIPVVTLGTALWARTEALSKLLKYDWKYEDFMEEPMSIDGSISHAIERIFAFIALDAGFETGTVMCNSYAEQLIGLLQMNMGKMFMLLKQISLDSVKNLKDVHTLLEMETFCKQHTAIYLYGAGKVGLRYLKMMRAMQCEPKGFVVTENKKYDYIDGLKVSTIKEIENKKDCGIIVAVGKAYILEVITELENRNLHNYIYFT